MTPAEIIVIDVAEPARAAASAAERPPGPLPTTSTSVSKMTSSDRAAS